MIYSKLEGTTSKQFKLGKNGIQFQLRENDPNILEIATPDGGLFVIGLSEVFNEAGQVTQPNAIPTATQIKDYIADSIGDIIGGDFSNLQTAIEALEDRVADIIGDDYENLGVMLNSIKELAAAIGNDPNFFTNIVEIIGTGYVENGDLYMPTNIPDENNDGSELPGKDGFLDGSTTEKTASISKRLSILEEHRTGQKLSRLSIIQNTSAANADIINKDKRSKQMVYVYEETIDGKVVQKKISLDELRKLRPGIYTGISGKDVENEDYVFEPMN
jgi:hypothetical protein